MKKWFMACAIVFVLALLTAAWSRADVIILKNGQVIHDVTITEDGDTLICESPAQSYFIDKSTVKNIIRTGKKPLWERIQEVIPTLPLRAKLFINDYFLIAAIVVGGLMLMLGLLAFKFLWINIRPVTADIAKGRQIKRDINRLDTDEKSVLREFFLQKANTLEMPVEDVAVSGLIRKGILQATRDQGQYSICGLMLPVSLSTAAGKHVRPRTVGLPPNILTDIHAIDEKLKDALARSRPQFMYDMASFYQTLEKTQRNVR